jgi:predicted transglutaminase-like cysteine proteinase
MKKVLITMLLAGSVLGISNDVLSQKIKRINQRKVKSIEIPTTKGGYSDRIDKINSIKYNDYLNMLKEVKDIRDAEIYCTKVLEASQNPYAQDSIDKILYGKDDYWASFRESYIQRLGDCDDGAMAAASLLYDNGFPPYFLTLNGKDSGHLVFLYKDKEGKFGTLGINYLDCRRPKHKNIKDLVNEFEEFMGEKVTYEILDAKEIFPQAIHSEGVNYRDFW